jgi:putative hydrolase of the HAD superfamily
MRAAIFDLDDTLYERELFVLSGFAAVADQVQRRFGLPAQWMFTTLKRARARGHEGRELQALCADHGLPDTLIPELVDVIRHHEPALTLGSVASAVIAQLRADGWRTAILTNGLPATQRRKVHALGLEARVDAVLYAEEHAPGGKPSRAAFDAAVAAVGVPAPQVVFIGDNLEKDIQGAHAAGLSTIRVAGTGDLRRTDSDADAIVRLEDVPAAAARLVKRSGAHAA